LSGIAFNLAEKYPRDLSLASSLIFLISKSSESGTELPAHFFLATSQLIKIFINSCLILAMLLKLSSLITKAGGVSSVGVCLIFMSLLPWLHAAGFDFAVGLLLAVSPYSVEKPSTGS